jgi:hypothetical protein
LSGRRLRDRQRHFDVRRRWPRFRGTNGSFARAQSPGRVHSVFWHAQDAPAGRALAEFVQVLFFSTQDVVTFTTKDQHRLTPPAISSNSPREKDFRF